MEKWGQFNPGRLASTKPGSALSYIVISICRLRLQRRGANGLYALSNAWIVNNSLDLGAHGAHICHARDPQAIEVYCQMAARFSCDYPDTPRVARQGMGLRVLQTTTVC